MAKIISGFLFTGLTLLAFVEGRKELTLSKSPSYVLGYEVNEDKITIDIVAATTGYIGFGVSLFPNMTGADLIIAGVYENGSSYCLDYIGVGNQSPELDKSQDCTPGVMSENKAGGTTSVSFTRLLDTGDSKQDVPIKNEEIWVLWAIGPNDEPGLHKNRGSAQLNLLAP